MNTADGKALSIGSSGRSVVISQANGGAFSIAVSKIKEPVYINHTSDSLKSFNKAINVINDCNRSKIIFKTCEFKVENTIRDKMKYSQFYKEQQIKVNNIVTPFFNCVLDVIDNSDDHDKFLKYLFFRNEQNESYLKYIPIDYKGTESITESKSSYSISINKERTDKIEMHIQEPIKPIPVYTKDQIRLITRDLNIMCENNIANSFNSKVNIQPIYITVEDYKQPTIGVVTAGGSLTGFKITVQKLSYIEQTLSFEDKTVLSITGLPQGMTYENGKLKGSPTVSGKYAITINMDDATVMSGLIVVTQVPRKL